MKARLPKPPITDLSSRFALTVPECAQALGLNEKTVRNRIYAGELPATRMGRSVVVLVEALRVYLRQHTVWPANPNWAQEADSEPTYIHAPRQRA